MRGPNTPEECADAGDAMTAVAACEGSLEKWRAVLEQLSDGNRDLNVGSAHSCKLCWKYNSIYRQEVKRGEVLWSDNCVGCPLYETGNQCLSEFTPSEHDIPNECDSLGGNDPFSIAERWVCAVSYEGASAEEAIPYVEKMIEALEKALAWAKENAS